MRHFEKTIFFNHSAPALVELFTRPSFLEEEAREVQGAFEASFIDEIRTEGRVKGRLEQVTPSRDPRSRAKKASSAILYDWDINKMSCTWVRVPAKPDGVEISGSHQVVPTNTGCSYTMRWDLTVKMPIVGRVMEKKIETTVLAGVDDRRAFALRHLA